MSRHCTRLRPDGKPCGAIDPCNRKDHLDDRKPQITLDTKDSGRRQEFETGSVRDTREGKGRFDLLSPFALMRLALVCERGAAKYGDRNWERGQPVMRYADSAIRHLYGWIGGDRSEDHLAQAMWNLMAMIHTEEMVVCRSLPTDLYDSPTYDRSNQVCAKCGSLFPLKIEGQVLCLACQNNAESAL